MTRDEEVTVVEIFVASNDLCDLREHLTPLLLQFVFARVEENVAGKLDDEAVVARHDLDAERIQLVELRTKLTEATFDDGELIGALLVFRERLLELRGVGL